MNNDEYMKALAKLTEIPPADKQMPTEEMAERILEGRLDWIAGIGWHDPRGRDPETSRNVDAALKLARQL